MIARECQLEGWMNSAPQKRKAMILEVMGDKPMTARMIAYKIGFSDLNAVKPRLTELKQEGKIEVIDKALDEITGVHVSVYRRRKDD